MFLKDNRFPLTPQALVFPCDACAAEPYVISPPACLLSCHPAATSCSIDFCPKCSVCGWAFGDRSGTESLAGARVTGDLTEAAGSCRDWTCCPEALG